MKWSKILKAKAYIVSDVRYVDGNIGSARNAPTTFLVWESDLDRFVSNTGRGKIVQYLEEITGRKVLDFTVKEGGLGGPPI